MVHSNEQIKNLLEQKKKEVSSRLEALKKDRRRVSGPIAQDYSEQAIETQNDEVIDAIDSVDMKELDSIERAIMKLNNGRYGICEECGEKISDKRLNAIPYASLCSHCLA